MKGSYFLVDTRLKLTSNRHSRLFDLQREHGLGAVFRASHRSLACLQPVQLLARLAGCLKCSRLITTMHFRGQICDQFEVGLSAYRHEGTVWLLRSRSQVLLLMPIE